MPRDRLATPVTPKFVSFPLDPSVQAPSEAVVENPQLPLAAPVVLPSPQDPVPVVEMSPIEENTPQEGEVVTTDNQDTSSHVSLVDVDDSGAESRVETDTASVFER